MNTIHPTQFSFRGYSRLSLIVFAAELGLSIVLLSGYSAPPASQMGLDVSADSTISSELVS